MMKYASVSALEISSLRTFELTLFDRPDRRFHFILTLFNKKGFPDFYHPLFSLSIISIEIRGENVATQNALMMMKKKMRRRESPMMMKYHRLETIMAFPVIILVNMHILMHYFI